MSKTAYLRPLITENFTFDFPSQFSTKELSSFIDNNYSQITSEASHDMQSIMRGSEVLWYIQSKTTKKIVGWVKFHFENSGQTIAKLYCELDGNLSSNNLSEISNRIAHICTNNLNLEKIIISSTLNDFICQELKIHYNMDNNKLILK